MENLMWKGKTNKWRMKKQSSISSLPQILQMKVFVYLEMVKNC
jgi:hypothetical protein